MSEVVNKLEELRKITDYFVYRISRRFPFMEEVYKQVKLETELPQFVPDEEYDKDYCYCTDGTVLYVNPKVKDIYENKSLEVELELIHELLHIYMGHPIFASKRSLADYNVICDVEVNQWIKQLYPNKNTKKYPVKKEQAEGGAWNHFLWYPDVWGCSINILDKIKPISLSAWENEKGDSQMNREEEVNGQGNIGGKMNENADIGKDGTKNARKYLQVISKESALSYIDVMKRYMYTQERSCRTDEELDMILYSYGFDLYGDITFVEPPETIEEKIISFYMAIDTSGSCDREKVSKFLGHTKSVIQELSDNGKNKIDIHLFMADSKIDQELHICKIEDFPRVSDLIISGGLTDFRPVIERVVELEQTDKTEKMGKTGKIALFYYTDGLGFFPEMRPDFDTWFLMDEQDIKKLKKREEKTDAKCFMIPEWVHVIEI